MTAAPMVTRLLSNRAVWLALALTVASLGAFLRHRGRAARLEVVNRRRRAKQLNDAEQPLRAELRRAIEQAGKLSGLALRDEDRLDTTYDLGLRQTRTLIDLLEERLDCSLPDSKVVRRLTIGEILAMLERQTRKS